jgi:hypothetical protein
MRSNLSTVLAAVLLAIPPALAAQGPAAEADRTYTTLLERLQKGDTAVDYTAFRMARAHSSTYSPYDPPEAAERLDELAEASSWQALRATADTVLAADFTEVNAHVLYAYAAQHLGDPKGAQLHGSIARGLVASLHASGDGTREHPFVVIAVPEEYAYLRARGLRRGGQSLEPCGPHQRDAMETVAQDGTKATLYFDVSLPMGALERSLTSGKQ